MKSMIVLLSLLALPLTAELNNSNKILDKQLKKAMEDEKRYAIEQKFYTEDEYDFKGAEVNEESLKNIKAIEPDPNSYNSDFIDMPN